MTTTLVLWRHGVTDWNQQSLFQGQSDIPLNARGLEMARRTAPHIAALQPAVIFCSPLIRARQTAQFLTELTGLDATIDERLAEMNVGSWAGQSIAAAKEADPAFAAAIAAGEDYRRSPEGETCMEVGARVTAALVEIAAAHRDQTIAVVGHGLSTRMGVAGLLGWDFRGSAALGGMANCGWAILQSSGSVGVDSGVGPRRWRLRAYNASVVKAEAGANADA